MAMGLLLASSDDDDSQRGAGDLNLASSIIVRIEGYFHAETET